MFLVHFKASELFSSFSFSSLKICYEYLELISTEDQLITFLSICFNSKNQTSISLFGTFVALHLLEIKANNLIDEACTDLVNLFNRISDKIWLLFTQESSKFKVLRLLSSLNIDLLCSTELINIMINWNLRKDDSIDVIMKLCNNNHKLRDEAVGKYISKVLSSPNISVAEVFYCAEAIYALEDEKSQQELFDFYLSLIHSSKIDWTIKDELLNGIKRRFSHILTIQFLVELFKTEENNHYLLANIIHASKIVVVGSINTNDEEFTIFCNEIISYSNSPYCNIRKAVAEFILLLSEKLSEDDSSYCISVDPHLIEVEEDVEVKNLLFKFFHKDVKPPPSTFHENEQESSLLDILNSFDLIEDRNCGNNILECYD